MEYLENQDLISFIQFISENFDFILALFFAFLISLVTLLITLKFSDQEFRSKFPFYFRTFLFVVIVLAQGFLLVSGSYIIWQKAKNPPVTIVYPEEIKPDTRWARSPIKIFYIHENQFFSIGLDGENNALIYRAQEPLREFHFSPDGQYVILNGFKEFVLLKRATGKVVGIDSVDFSADKGAISGIRWSPNSEHFVYEKSFWSSFTSIQKTYIYSVVDGQKREINFVPKKVFSLFWDESGKNLYFLDVKAKDLSLYSYPFEMKVYRITLENLAMEFIGDIVIKKNTLPLDSLEVRGIKLFLAHDQFSFKRDQSKMDLERDAQRALYIDKGDFLNYRMGKFGFKRFFKIPREPDSVNPTKYQYKGGNFTIESIRWIDDTDYVLLIDKYQDVLILDSITGTCGRLMGGRYDVIGWAE